MNTSHVISRQIPPMVSAFISGASLSTASVSASRSACTWPNSRIAFLTSRKSASRMLAVPRMVASGDVSKIVIKEIDQVSGPDDERRIAKYEIQGILTGAESEKMYRKVLAEAKKKANFPGFRPGTIPPFLINQIDFFTLNQLLNDKMTSVINENGLELLGNEMDEPDFTPSFDEMKKRFKAGADFAFKATIVLGSKLKDEDSADADADADAASETAVAAESIEASVEAPVEKKKEAGAEKKKKAKK
mmetsp:Transcript_11724/g.20135  ORF Transcript_11724/g.20135 Transcript_11724/m.20135 type:complete len:247 (+) Transcript_11724:17-757(+)